MRILMAILAMVGLSSHAFASAFYHVGYQDLSKPFHGRVWYPVDIRVQETPISTSKLFQSPLGKKNATPVAQPEHFPLLLLSHGSGGSFDRLDWMADYFVRRGWLVAALNHPGNTREDNTVEGLVQVWKRAEQLSSFLTFLLERHPLRHRIDQEHIAAAGHSAGGTTVILLAGGRFLKEKFQNPIPFCVPEPRETDDEHCAALHQYDFQKHTQEEIERSYRDRRIKTVVALDPAFSHSFQREEKNTDIIPILFVFAGKRRDESGEIFATEFKSLFPGQRYLTVPDAVHISFVSTCSEFGVHREAPICFENHVRKNIHRQANEATLNFFDAQNF